jgi:hypothetical protein
MEKFVTGMLLRFIKLVVDSKVFEHIQGLVTAYLNVDNMAGEEKKKAVTAQLQALEGDIGGIVADMSGWLLSTAIDIAHAYIVTHSEK